MYRPLLSIIVPAYNAEKTIGKLIETIILQKYDDYELIIVNDGSTDATKKIVESYLNKSDKIVFINKENTGPGDTRNKGIEIAKGKYITFADSDDYYCNNFFDKIVPEIKKENFELLVFNANVFNYGKNIGSEISHKYKSEYFEEDNGVIKYLNGDFSYRIANCPWNKIYVGSIIRNNNIKYVNKKRGQDLVFNILYVSKIKKYRYINIALYNYNLDCNVFDKNYSNKEINGILEYYEPLRNICVNNNIINYKSYLGLFFLRRIPGIVVNEANNPNRKNGSDNLKFFLSKLEINDTLKQVKINQLGFKLFISYILYKLKLYKIMYNIMWIFRGRKNKKAI